MPQTEQHNNRWHSDHFIFFFFFFFFFLSESEGETICSPRTKLRAAAFWIIHFSNCNTPLQTFGLALKAYLMTRGSVSLPHSRGKIDCNGSPGRAILYGSQIYRSASLNSQVLLLNRRVWLGSYPQLSSPPRQQSWLTQRLSINISHGWMRPLCRRCSLWKSSAINMFSSGYSENKTDIKRADLKGTGCLWRTWCLWVALSPPPATICCFAAHRFIQTRKKTFQKKTSFFWFHLRDYMFSLPVFLPHRVPGTVWRQRTSDCGGPLGFDRLQGGARHPQLQGGGPPHPEHRVVQGWRARGDGQGWPPLSPHAPAQRLPLLPAHRARAPEQTRRGRLHLCGPQLPGRGH